MAKLSNINGLFAVEDDGAIQFNGQAGTSGYVLESRGASSPPVWTDRDTGNVTGSGTENKVVRWTATGSTIGDGPITFATNDSTFAGNLTIDQGDGTGGVAAGISRIHTGTADATDNGGITISSAGATSTGRGAYMYLQGNENDGDARIYTGNAANAELFLIASGTSGSAIRMQTAGADKMRITSSAEGHVELSGTAPVIKATASNGGSGLRINIAGQTSGQLFRVQEDGTTKFQINENGNVGIGTTSPDLGGVAGTRVLTIASPTAERWGILELAGNRTYGGNQVGEIKFISTDSTNNGVLVSLTAINDPSATGTGGSLKFSTRADGGTISEKMRITSAGNVGIGTTSPGKLLSVIGADGRNVTTYLAEIVNNDNTSDQGHGLLVGGGNNANHHLFQVNASGSAVFVIKGDGNVGIGETSPSSLLHLKKATGDPMINIQAVASGDPGITFTSINNRTGNIFYSDGTTNAMLRYDHADVSFKLYAHNTTVADFVLNETTAYFPTQNVGIGTTSPSTPLHIVGNVYSTTRVQGGNSLIGSNTISSTNFATFGSNSSGVGIALARDFNASSYPDLIINSAGNVGIGTASPTAKLEIVTAVGADAIRMNYGQSADIFLGFSSANPRILLQDNSNVITHNFVSNGDNYIVGSNVGIGETSPLVPLHISKDSASGENIALLLDNNNTTAGNEIGILFRSMAGSTNTDFEIFGKANGANDMDLVFQSDGSVERMRIDSSGNVGIGTDGTNIVVTGKGLGIQNIGQDTTASMRLTGHNATGNPGVATYTELKHYGATLSFGINHNGGTDAITINSSKKVGIGNTSPAGQLDILTSTETMIKLRNSESTSGKDRDFKLDDNNKFEILDNNGTGVSLSQGSGSWSSESDERLKENIVELDNVLENINNLRAVKYNYKNGNDTKIGFIAQDWQKDFSEVIEEGEHLSMKYTETIPVLLKAIQELKAEIEILKNK
jgi:hypothetical protein